MSKEVFLDLGRQPIANKFVSTEEDSNNEYFFDLQAQFDSETKLVSLANFVDPPKLFNEDYPYRAGASPATREHFKKAAQIVGRYLKQGTKVLEIGSNDGSFIGCFDSDMAVAVEPCGNFAKETRNNGYDTYDAFWDGDLAETILSNNGPQQVVYSANCMCHIPDIQEAFAAVEKVLDTDGVFIFEDPNALFMLLRNSYDQIYDEHAHIFSLIALEKLLANVDMHIVKVDVMENVHGGSCRVYAAKCGSPHWKPGAFNVPPLLEFEKQHGMNGDEPYFRFGDRVSHSKQLLRKTLSSFKEAGKKILSAGATSKSTVVFNYCDIGPDLVEYITDTTPEKIGKLSPGKHIPICHEKEHLDDTVDVAFLGAWNFKDRIMDKHSDKDYLWVTHVPEVQVI